MSNIVIRRYEGVKLDAIILVAYESFLNDVDPKLQTFYPANGGCRLMVYDSEEDAIAECRYLAHMMSLKHKTFSTGFTGGKIVVCCPNLEQIDRRILFAEVSDALFQLEGRVLTGCDINTTMDDMKVLSEMTSREGRQNGYVLAGIDSRCDPNKATALGVAAAVQELATLIEPRDGILTVLVLGVGKVGSHVAALLLRMPNFVVLVADKIAGHAARAVPYAVDVSDKDWSTIDHDILVPCAGSRIIDTQVARRLKCRGVCGSSNIPIADEDAMGILRKKGTFFVPETISSAGAILQDSIEHYGNRDFRQSHPSYVYAFISSLIADKTRQFLQRVNEQPSLDPYSIFICGNKISDDDGVVGIHFAKWKSCMASTSDIVIVGAGMAGTACAYNLVKDGFPGSAELIEQGEVANPQGSSNGDSRMYREMYSDPFYSKMMSKSLGMWSEIEDVTQTKLLSCNGLLFFGSSGTGETAEGSILGSIETLRTLGVEHEVIRNNKELSERFDGLNPEEGDIGVFSIGDGEINATAACRAMAKFAEQGGVTIREGVTVLSIYMEDVGSAAALLLLSNWSIVAARRKLVLATGGWTTRLLKEQFDSDMNSKVQMVAWGHFELPDGAADMPQWFCFRSNSHTDLPLADDQHGLYYGFPAVQSKHGGKTKRVVKIGTDFTPHCAYSGHLVPAVNKREVHKELRDDIHSFVRSHWPNLGDEVDLQYSPYHMTPSQDFVLGALPGVPQVVLFCGGSGRAFKFAPLLGACLSDLARGKKPRVDISRFDPTNVIMPSVKKANSAEEGGQGRPVSSALGKSHVPFGERGEGIYSLATQGCFDVMKAFECNVMEAFEKSAVPELLKSGNRHPVVFCDFGAADGGTSLGLWTELIRRCKELSPDCEIEMKYEDQPNADYQSLFHYTQGLVRVPGRTDKTYLEEEFGDKVFVSAVGTSFYRQCLPSGSLGFGYSATAMHWLSSTPEVGLPSGVLHHTQLRKDNPVSIVWAKRAAEDWESLLLARAAELRSGAAMVIVSLCVDEHGQWLGNTKAVPKSMFAEMARHWVAMMEGGRISKAEFDRMEILNYYRTLAEMKTVLENDSSVIYQAGLRLEMAETRVTPCCYRASWLREGGDAKAFASALTMSMRTWSNSSFKSALDKTRTAEDKLAITDELFARFAKAIADDPDQYGMDYVHAFVSLRKT